MKKVILLCFIMVASVVGAADWTPFKFSLFAPAALPPMRHEVLGFRLNLIYGRDTGVYGLDVGLAQHVRGDAAGLEVGGSNFVTGDFSGIQVAYGSNFALKEMDGLQIGWYNCCRGTAKGLQIGAVNMTQNMQGVQIGIVNFIWKSPLVAFPIVNMAF